MTGYTAREVAEILDLSIRQVRSYARSGLISPDRGPRGEYRFSFQDIVVLRAASEMLKARIHPRTVRRTLTLLRDQLPKGRSLAAVQISAEGERPIVREGASAWEPESGQHVLDFSVAELASRAEPFAQRVIEEGIEGDELAADDWYNLAYDLEAVSPVDAKDGYLRAVSIDPEHAEAHLNLGRLLHEEGRLDAAEHHYRRAIGVRPGSAVCWFNLGVVLEDRERVEDAIHAYAEAVGIDPDLASAHYNLSRLYERAGADADALRHLAEYRRLEQDPTRVS